VQATGPGYINICHPAIGFQVERYHARLAGVKRAARANGVVQACLKSAAVPAQMSRKIIGRLEAIPIQPQ
jgi:hypothetical protein